MLFRETVAVYCEISMEHMYIHCVGTYSDHSEGIKWLFTFIVDVLYIFSCALSFLGICRVFSDIYLMNNMSIFWVSFIRLFTLCLMFGWAPGPGLSNFINNFGIPVIWNRRVHLGQDLEPPDRRVWRVCCVSVSGMSAFGKWTQVNLYWNSSIMCVACGLS
jgi:hypothetical protein